MKKIDHISYNKITFFIQCPFHIFSELVSKLNCNTHIELNTSFGLWVSFADADKEVGLADNPEDMVFPFTAANA